jgi:hypothetical protein
MTCRRHTPRWKRRILREGREYPRRIRTHLERAWWEPAALPAVDLDRAAGTATVAGRAYRVSEFRGPGAFDVSAPLYGGGTWLGAFCACHGVEPREGGRTSQRRRWHDVLRAIAAAWWASEARDG